MSLNKKLNLAQKKLEKLTLQKNKLESEILELSRKNAVDIILAAINEKKWTIYPHSVGEFNTIHINLSPENAKDLRSVLGKNTNYVFPDNENISITLSSYGNYFYLSYKDHDYILKSSLIELIPRFLKFGAEFDFTELYRFPHESIEKAQQQIKELQQLESLVNA